MAENFMPENFTLVNAELIRAESLAPTQTDPGRFSFVFRLADGSLATANKIIMNFEDQDNFGICCKHILSHLGISHEKLWHDKKLSWYVRLAYENGTGKVRAIGHILKPKLWFPMDDGELPDLDPFRVETFRTTEEAPYNCQIRRANIQQYGPNQQRVVLLLKSQFEDQGSFDVWADIDLANFGASVRDVMKLGGVDEWEKLEKRYVRVRHQVGFGREFGDIFGNYWMTHKGVLIHKDFKRSIYDGDRTP